MEKQRIVVLYRASLFVAGIETSLKNWPELDVVRIDITLPEAERHLKSCNPHVILFDSAEANLSTLPGISQLLKEQPEVMVIGLDSNTTDLITIFSSQQHSVSKIEDLVKAIQSEYKPTNSMGTDSDFPPVSIT